MSNAPNIEKARKEADRADFVTMSDKAMFAYYIDRNSKSTQLKRRFVGEMARPHLLERMEGGPTGPWCKRDSSNPIRDRSQHEKARTALILEQLTHEGLMDLYDIAVGFASGPPRDEKWFAISEICKTHIYRRLNEGSADRYSKEYSKAKAIDYILDKQFCTSIRALIDYIHLPVFSHEKGEFPLKTKVALDIKARILCGRTVLAACGLEKEADYRKMKEMEPSSRGGGWDYGEPLQGVRAFLGHAIDFEYKLRAGFFDKFTPNDDPDREKRYVPPPKFIGSQLWSNLPLNSGSE
jgi:hypothetical protein